MNLHRFALTALALVLGWIAPVAVRAHGIPAGPAQYGRVQDQENWDTPPAELQDIQRRGFHDGIIGAQRDIENHRRPDPNNRDEYRHPNVPPGDWEAYREGFRRGYERGIAHFTGGEQQPVPPPNPGWPQAQPPAPWMEIRQRGFQDGMVGALRDLENHRNPDPNNRDEYRHPDIGDEFMEAYRTGFRDGYQRCIEILTAGPERDERYMGPGSEIRMRGFHDGADGALKDFENHRQPNPNNRDEYRDPRDVPYELQEAYRDGFRHGYERVMSELSGYHPNRY